MKKILSGVDLVLTFKRKGKNANRWKSKGVNQVILRLLWVEPSWKKTWLPQEFGSSFAPMQVCKTLCYKRLIWWCAERNDQWPEQGGQQIPIEWKLCTEIEPCGWRWDEDEDENEVGQQMVNKCVLTDTLADRQKMRTGRERIVQVMHSLRLLSLVSHTLAPMHSLPTLSHYKNRFLLHIKRREERGIWWRCCCLYSKCPQRGQTVDIVCRC